jgi:hypothetical protein
MNIQLMRKSFQFFLVQKKDKFENIFLLFLYYCKTNHTKLSVEKIYSETEVEKNDERSYQTDSADISFLINTRSLLFCCILTITC